MSKKLKAYREVCKKALSLTLSNYNNQTKQKLIKRKQTELRLFLNLVEKKKGAWF